MTVLEWAMAGLGFTVTALVVAGMILLAPRGEVELDHGESHDGQGAQLSRAGLRSPAGSRP